MSLGLAPARDSQWEAAPPAAPVDVPRAKGHGDSWAGQAAQKGAADAKKKKKAEVARRKYEKEKEIARRVKARENRSDVELELESKDPTEVGDDIIFSEEEESREVFVTSVEHCDPTAASTGDE